MPATCKYYVAKTFAHLAGGLAIASASSQVPLVAYLPKSTAVMITVVVVSVLILVFGVGLLSQLASTSPYKYPLALLITMVFGQMLSSLVYQLDEKDILLDVLTMTTGVFGGMIALGLWDNQHIVGLGGYLAAALLGLIAGYLMLFVLRATKTVSGSQAGTGQTALSGLGVALFAVYTAYDTQLMKARARTCSGSPDYVNEATAFFLDFVNLFTNLANLQR